MKGKMILYALVVSLVSTLLSWGQFFSALSRPQNSGSTFQSRTGGGNGTWGNGTGGTWGGGGGHK